MIVKFFEIKVYALCNKLGYISMGLEKLLKHYFQNKGHSGYLVAFLYIIDHIEKEHNIQPFSDIIKITNDIIFNNYSNQKESGQYKLIRKYGITRVIFYPNLEYLDKIEVWCKEETVCIKVAVEESRKDYLNSLIEWYDGLYVRRD